MSGTPLNQPLDKRSAAYIKKVAENIGYKGYRWSGWDVPEDIENLHKVVESRQIGEELSHTAVYFDHVPTDSEVKTALQLVEARFYFAGTATTYSDGTHWLDFDGTIKEKIAAFSAHYEGDPVD